MTSPILWRGGEDLEFNIAGGYTSVTTGSTPGIFIDTTSGHFRAGYARYALTIAATNLVSNNNGDNSVGVNTYFLTNAMPFNSGSFWFSARISNNGSGGNGVIYDGGWLLAFRDSSLVVRLQIQNTMSHVINNLSPLGGPFIVQTVSTSGVATQIGNALIFGPSLAPLIPDKIDIFVNYGTSGQVIIYINGMKVYAYSGDITASSGLSSLATVSLSAVYQQNNVNLTAATGGTSWSEVIVSTRDTRNMSLITQVPVAAGVTDTFTAGSFSNVNGMTLNTTTPDYSSTAGQMQLYQAGGLPSGLFTILDLAHSFYVTVGDTGPQHLKCALELGGTAYFSTSIAPTIAWQNTQYSWGATNPATGVAWTPADVTASGFNFGYESVT